MSRTLLALLVFSVSAPLASAQTPVFEVRDASGATLHFAVNDDGTVTCTNCISGAEIADGTVEPADIDGGLFNGLTRDLVYQRSSAGTVSTGGESTRVVRCDGSEDLPVAGGCVVVGLGDVSLKTSLPLDWEDPSAAAGYGCTYFSGASTSVSYEARIWCLDVTPVAATRIATDGGLDLGPSRTDDL